jgi:hypothetical protein
MEPRRARWDGPTFALVAGGQIGVAHALSRLRAVSIALSYSPA